MRTDTIAEIHKGDRTHSQPQLMICVSLSPTNKTVNRPTKPMPPELELLTGWLFKSIQLEILQALALAMMNGIGHDGLGCLAKGFNKTAIRAK
jgi:hypothetical protein